MRSFKYCIEKGCKRFPARWSKRCSYHRNALMEQMAEARKNRVALALQREKAKEEVSMSRKKFVFDASREELVAAEKMLSAKPKTRADCPPANEPCPYLNCRYHLWVDVTRKGEVRESRVFGDLEHTCALNEVDKVGSDKSTLETVSQAMHCSRQRIDQLVQEALKKARRQVSPDWRWYVDPAEEYCTTDTAGGPCKHYHHNETAGGL